MKTNKLFFLFSILLSMLTTNALAYDFAVKNADGVLIYYGYTNNKKEVKVTCKEIAKTDYHGSVVIPKEVTYNNKTLKVTGIDSHAFYACSGLTSVTIPNSVTSIGSSAFWGCFALTSVTIPNKVTSIGRSAFNGCRSMTSVNIPNGVTTIPEDTFGGCSSLKSITIPNSVKSIGDHAFSSCSSLSSVTIGNSVTSIGEETFFYCRNLKSVKIPNSVTSIKDKAFAGCSALSSMIVEKNNPKYDSRNNCNAIIETKTNTLIVGCKNTVIPNNVKSIGKNAFYACESLTSITIPNSVTSFGYDAFYWCLNLKSVTSKIAKPFVINYSTFFKGFDMYRSTYSKATLYVPKGTVTKYKATESWMYFRNIVEEGTTTAINDVEADNTLNTANTIYDINGKRLPVTSLDELPSGLYIINGKKVVK